MNNKASLTIENVGEYKKKIMGLFEGKKEPVLELNGVEGIDLAGIQILCAFVREAMLRKIDFSFVGDVHESVRSGLILAGITDGLCLTGEDIKKTIKAVLYYGQ
jgi:anti-anti-sigma regulatory factor